MILLIETLVFFIVMTLGGENGLHECKETQENVSRRNGIFTLWKNINNKTLMPKKSIKCMGRLVFIV